MRQWIAVLSLLIVLWASFAKAEDAIAVPDPNGAVLCTWSRYVQLKIFATVCSFDSNSDFGSVLNESIARMDKFITENSTITQAQLDDKKKELLGQRQEDAAKIGVDGLRKACAETGGIAAAYRKLRDTDPTLIRQQIAKLLSVPRKPVMDPCL